MKRDFKDIGDMNELSDLSPFKLISPLREVNGELKFKMPTVLAASSLLR